MNDSPKPSVALVLGSGGVLGASFHAGVLLALSQTWGIDARSTAEILGTSAGAFTGAMLAAGLSPTDLVRREQGLPLSSSGRAIWGRRTESVGLKSQERAFGVGIGPPAAPQLALSAFWRPGTIRPGTVLAGLTPRGQRSTDRIEATITDVLGATWPTAPRLRLVAVNLGSGRREVFSAQCSVSIGAAVAASCAVPGIHAPVVIEGAEYIDGAAHSANNLDAVGRHDVVIVSSPSTGSSSRTRPWAIARHLWRLQLGRERKSLSDQTDVIVIEPDQRLLDAMGTDPMDTSKRASVAVAAHALAQAVFASRDNPIDYQTRA